MGRSTVKEQQQINGTENISLRGCIKKSVKITIRSHQTGLTESLHGIPYILKDSCRAVYDHSDNSYSRFQSVKNFTQRLC